jgi:hypothetical protein
MYDRASRESFTHRFYKTGAPASAPADALGAGYGNSDTE